MAEPLLERAKRCFKLAQESEAKQRQREQDDLKFQVPDLQWDEAARRQRSGGPVGGQVVPPRPIVSVSKLDQPIRLILNQARQARLGVNIHPVSEDADKEGAEVRQGLYRRIERDSKADQARLWGLDRAVKAGRGAYRVTTKWDEDSDPKFFDQEIVIERILYQDMVYFDPSAQKPDWSDGEWAFVAAWMSAEKFKREFPDAKTDVDDPQEWQSLVSDAPAWVKMDGEQKSFLVCEYWYKEHDYQKITGPRGQQRQLDVVSVKFAKLNGCEVLEEAEWNGKYIPLIPVVGVELQPFDSDRRWVGMIGPSKGGQQIFNLSASTFVERMAMEPKTPWVGPEGFMEGHEAEWQQSNTRNLVALQYKPTSIDGKPTNPPQRAQLDQTGMSLAMMGMQEADRLIQTTTSIYDPSLGRENPRDKSGKAIVALQQQSDAGTSHFVAALADVSMPYEALVVLDLMPKIYDRPGRLTTILKGDDDKGVEQIMLGQPFAPDPMTGKPVPVQPGQEGAKEYDLSKGKYSVSVDIGKSYQTRLQAGQDEIGALLQADPSLMMLIGDLYMGFRDFPGAQPIAERLKKVIGSKMPGLLDEGQKQSPEALEAENSQLKQQLQQMQQMAEEMKKALETEQVKAQATLQGKEMDNATRLEVAQQNNQTKILIAELQARIDGLENQLTRGHEVQRDREEMAHETGLAAMNARAGKELAAQNNELREPPKGKRERE